MRRRLIAIFILVFTLTACTPKLVEPDIVKPVYTPAPRTVKIAPTATPTPDSVVQTEAAQEWVEASTELMEEPSVETEDDDEKYAETVAVPEGTPTSLGTFVVTAYCDCVKCNGKWTGHKLNTTTQAGLPYPVEGYTISVDPEVIPLGSVVELDGLGARYAQDTGSAIKGKRIDLFFGSHEEALEFGVKKIEVWVYV